MELHQKLIQIQERIRNKNYRVTLHAEKERDADKITKREIEEAILSEKAEIIEDYPEDPRGESCLILGFTSEGEPIHIVCGVSTPIIIITVYRPDPELWIGWRKRRK